MKSPCPRCGHGAPLKEIKKEEAIRQELERKVSNLVYCFLQDVQGLVKEAYEKGKAKCK